MRGYAIHTRSGVNYNGETMNPNTHLPTALQSFIHASRYARWLPKEERRETWPETVQRYMDFMIKMLREKHNYQPEWDVVHDVHNAILNLDVMPSMRAMMTAGPALERDNIAGYNCSYLAVDHLRAFDEALYILMCGTGVGFSVERQEIAKLPEVPEEILQSETVVQFTDSKQGWARGYRQLIALLFIGEIPRLDYSKLRPEGARLKTFGGRASGPAPLQKLCEFTIKTVLAARGRKLTSLECHDLMCMVGDCVVSGGVRRSALISLSNLSDNRMRDAKSGQWWEGTPHRALANNSAVYTEKPEVGQFMREWLALYDSKSGERGIFNREAAVEGARAIGRKVEIDGKPVSFGTNPCGEIVLRSGQFCNLTEVVARADDHYLSLEKKVRLATILGTWQACLTDIRYVRSHWKKNTEEERLLGVSITGIADNEFTSRGIPSFLRDLREVARRTNKEEAAKIGIPASAAITCVKPSGTVSQLVDTASGIHGRFARFYIRRVRHSNSDPLTQFMKDAGVLHEADLFNPSVTVFSFPCKAPFEVEHQTAVEQLERWRLYKNCWTDHNPSVTISVEEHEWPEVGAWVYKNFDICGGLSFLPKTDHVYQQAPYEAIDETTYNRLVEAMPAELDFSSLHEPDDETTGTRELACVSGVCELP